MNDDPEFAPTLADVLALFHRRAGNEYTRDMAGKVSFSFYFRIIWAIRGTDEFGFVYRLSWTRTKANWRARVVKTFTTSCDLTTSVLSGCVIFICCMYRLTRIKSLI